VPLVFSGAKKVTYPYELRARNPDKSRVQGVSTADFIYMLMPDRFANGDPKNDVVKSTRVNHIARDSMYARHGGDLKGIENHFDYLKSLGVTAIWPTPVVENDMPKASYHGYAVTDYYAVDPRFGSNEKYVQFVQKAHNQGLKVIHDVVLNHMGSYNYLQLDPPTSEWVHQWASFTRSNYNNAPLNDPYASQYDTKLYSDGWFDTTMPDLNQSNPVVANYLIQNFIWWVEYTGLDGYRIDTYPYSDATFLLQWGKALQEEYPQLGLFGEATVHSPAQEAFFARNIFQPVDGFKANLPSLLDFPLNGAIIDVLKSKEPTDISKLYYTLQADWMYQDPTRNVVFLDNHDMSRFYSVIGEDFNKMKMGLAWLMTTRGIPNIYYGTEVLMKNFSDPDGKVREDFPGGWPGDKKNYFTAAGRTGQAGEAFNYLSKLGLYRKAHPVLQTGKLMQFIPDQNVYTYFRYSDAGTVMVLMNVNKEPKTVDGGRFAERTNGFSAGTEVVSGAAVPSLKSFTIPGHTAWVVELRK
jgi:glycosidase